MSKKKNKDFSVQPEEDKRTNEELAAAVEAGETTPDIDELLRRFEAACRQLAKPHAAQNNKLLKVWLKGKPYRVTPEVFAQINPSGNESCTEEEALALVQKVK